MKKKKRENFFLMNPKNTPKEESLFIRAKYMVYDDDYASRARFFLFSLNLSLSFSLSLCVVSERAKEREAAVRRRRYMENALCVVSSGCLSLGKHREKKKRDKKSGIRKTRARDIYIYNALSLKIRRDKRERERLKSYTRWRIYR